MRLRPAALCPWHHLRTRNGTVPQQPRQVDGLADRALVGHVRGFIFGLAGRGDRRWWTDNLPSIMRRSLTRPLRGVPCATRRRLSSSAAASLATRLNGDLASMHEAGTYKVERVITSAMDPAMRVAESDETVLNFCANNYLGFSNHPRLVEAAGRYLKRRAARPLWGTAAARAALPAAALACTLMSYMPLPPPRSHGLGVSSVRFICGTQDIHKRLETAISAFHRTDDTILFP